MENQKLSDTISNTTSFSTKTINPKRPVLDFYFQDREVSKLPVSLFFCTIIFLLLILFFQLYFIFSILSFDAKVNSVVLVSWAFQVVFVKF